MHSFWSLSVWIFSALLLAALLFSLLRRMRGGKRSSRKQTPTTLPTQALSSSATENPLAQGGPLPRIAWDAFLQLCANSGDLIVIDLREEAQSAPLPVVDSVYVLPIRLHELVEILELVPVDKAVVFYGVSDLGMLLIETSSFMQRQAPTFVLDLDAIYLEVA